MFIIIVFKQTFCAFQKSGGALFHVNFFLKLFLEDKNDIANTKNERLKNFHKLFKKLNFALFYFVTLDKYFIG